MLSAAATIDSFTMNRVRSVLQLMRFPAVFTALADIVLGFISNHRGIAGFERTFGLLLGASFGLYLAGMVFNDVFDRDIDARERPQRPIPSGRISLRFAVVLGLALLAGGLLCAALAGMQSLAIAAGLTAAIFAYNAILKRTPLGPIGMGACRFLNVMLGASGHSLALAVWSRYQWQLAAAMGLYIVGVTWFARNEATESRRWPLVGALGIVNAGIAAMGCYVAIHHAGMRSSQTVLMALAVMALIINRRLVTTLVQPDPNRVQTAVKMLLYSYVLLEATLIFSKTQNPVIAIGTAALLIPAMFLGRWIYIT